MTSGLDSSGGAAGQRPISELESLAGLFHPHAIGVQDFSYYALVIDVRKTADFERDHIPGAVRMDPLPERVPVLHKRLPQELSSLLRSQRTDAVSLVYCGRGGLDSERVAKALQEEDCAADILPGGWLNYRRWVQAGLWTLPRLVMFRRIETTSTVVPTQELARIAGEGQQVLDLQGLAAQARSGRRRPSQAWFESLLIQALRRVDPSRPVWSERGAIELTDLRVPTALGDALQVASSG